MGKAKQRSAPANARPASVAAPPPAAWPSRAAPAAAALLALLTVAVMHPTLRNGFTNWDDPGYVLENPYIDLRLDNLGAWLTRPVQGHLHPLTMISLAVDHAFGGTTNALPYHLTSLLLHALNAVLVFYFVLRLTGGVLPVAVITALFFAIHPLHVESVAWVSGRKDVLYAAFFFAALLSWQSYVASAGERRWYVLALLLGAASMLAKSAAVVLPLVLLLVDAYAGRPLRRELVVEKLPFFLLSLAAGGLMLRTQAMAINEESYAFGERLFYAGWGFCAYLLKAFYWGRLSAFYPYPVGAAVPAEYYLGLPAVVALAAAAWLYGRGRRALWFGLGFYAVTIVLVLQLVTIGSALLADRYTYVPYVGVFFLVGSAWAAARPLALRHAFTALLVVLALAAARQTYLQTQVWHDSLSLWNQAIENYPTARNAYLARGAEYQARQQGDLALRDFDTAERMRPGFLHSVVGKARTLEDLGRYQEALDLYNRHLSSSRPNADLLHHRGVCLMKLKRFEEAVKSFSDAIALRADQAVYWDNRAAGFFNLKQYAPAVADYTRALELGADPYQGRKNRAAAHLLGNDFAPALADLDEVIRRKPSDGEAYYYRSLCHRKLGHPDAARADALAAKGLGFALPAGYLQGN